ncbi:hypothetical protein ACS6JN_22225 [Enterobacter hormaechei subsp. steigerwaltii]|uniref:hypothetical protein n=1 Tax=Enterobacter hormaechei TaxID=158836 RepID=UPI002074E031|nr:hypothetical protein [Enterobacter hormaechei]MCM7649616.1 hypothetical protein [Enterobacter hormaechei]
MNEIDALLGFEDETETKFAEAISFERIWRLAIFGLNCQKPPQVKIPEGVVLPSAFDLREASESRKEPEKSLSFMCINHPVYSDFVKEEDIHMEIMSSQFKKNSRDSLRKNRCSLLIQKETISQVLNSDPINTILLEKFLFKESQNGERSSSFSDASGFHWEGHYLCSDELEIISLKSILAKCARIVCQPTLNL